MVDPLEVAQEYVLYFAARHDVYSHWTPEGWRPVREPLTGEVALAGLTRKGPSISGYLISPESKSHVFAVDFDGEDGYRQAIALGVQMHADGMPVYVETSRRGAHLWGCLAGVLSAKDIRKGLRLSLTRADIAWDDPKVELRPGSDTIDEDGLGHCLRMPMMPHPKTGDRGMLLDPLTEQPLGRSLSAIMNAIELVPVDTLAGFAAMWSPPRKPTDMPTWLRPPRAPRDDAAYGTASQILMEKWGVQRAIPGHGTRCPAHDDTRASLLIFRDDLRVLCYAPACILNNDGHGRGTYELTQLAPHE